MCILSSASTPSGHRNKYQKRVCYIEILLNFILFKIMLLFTGTHTYKRNESNIPHFSTFFEALFVRMLANDDNMQ